MHVYDVRQVPFVCYIKRCFIFFLQDNEKKTTTESIKAPLGTIYTNCIREVNVYGDVRAATNMPTNLRNTVQRYSIAHMTMSVYFECFFFVCMCVVVAITSILSISIANTATIHGHDCQCNDLLAFLFVFSCIL